MISNHMVTLGNTWEKRNKRLSKNTRDLKGNIKFLNFGWEKKKRGRKEKGNWHNNDIIGTVFVKQKKIYKEPLFQKNFLQKVYDFGEDR